MRTTAGTRGAHADNNNRWHARLQNTYNAVMSWSAKHVLVNGSSARATIRAKDFPVKIFDTLIEPANHDWGPGVTARGHGRTHADHLLRKNETPTAVDRQSSHKPCAVWLDSQ